MWMSKRRYTDVQLCCLEFSSALRKDVYWLVCCFHLTRLSYLVLSRSFSRKDNVLALWHLLLELLRSRRRRLELSHELQKTFQEMLYILDWVDEIKVSWCFAIIGWIFNRNINHTFYSSASRETSLRHVWRQGFDLACAYVIRVWGIFIWNICVLCLMLSCYCVVEKSKK